MQYSIDLNQVPNINWLSATLTGHYEQLGFVLCLDKLGSICYYPDFQLENEAKHLLNLCLFSFFKVRRLCCVRQCIFYWFSRSYYHNEGTVHKMTQIMPLTTAFLYVTVNQTLDKLKKMSQLLFTAKVFLISVLPRNSRATPTKSGSRHDLVRVQKAKDQKGQCACGIYLSRRLY